MRATTRRYPALAKALVGVVPMLLLLCFAKTATATEIRVGLTLSDDIYLAPIFAADKLGLFKKAGIEVKQSSIRDIAVGLEALTAGQVDIIDAPGPAAALATDEGLPGKIIVTNASGFYGWTIIVRAKTGLQSVGELNGKNVGITAVRSLAGMAASLAQDRAKITINIQALGAGALIPALRDNKIDAIISPAGLGLREVSGGRARIAYDLSLGKEMYTVSTLIASNAMMQKRSSDLKAFLAARSAALKHMQDNPKWALDMLKEYAHLTDTVLLDQMYKNIIRRMDVIGATNEATLKAALNLASRSWKAPKLGTINPANLFTNEFLPQAGK